MYLQNETIPPRSACESIGPLIGRMNVDNVMTGLGIPRLYNGRYAKPSGSISYFV